MLHDSGDDAARKAVWPSFWPEGFSAFGQACDPVLDPDLAKVSIGGHAPATPLKAVLHLCYLAANSPSKFIRVFGASFVCMLFTSLRFCDAMRSVALKHTDQALDGRARKGKMHKGPML